MSVFVASPYQAFSAINAAIGARFHYALLRPVAQAGAELANAQQLGSSTLGIEVTEAKLAADCGLGNIDPQHGIIPVARAAIDVALSYPLPPAGSILATLRPDLDSLGAMAVLALRSLGAAISADALQRVQLVADADCFANGPWPGRRPVPRRLSDLPAITSLLGPMQSIAGNPTLPVELRVAQIAAWLATGIEPEGARQAWSHDFADRLQTKSFVKSLSGGRIAIVMGGGWGLQQGYCVAPVVLAATQISSDRRKFTLAQYTIGHLDLGAVRQMLRAIEPGWGGSDTLIGSPQGVGSALTVRAVLRCVLPHL